MIDCEFCAQIDQQYTIRNRILYKNQDVAVWPSLGALVPGHVLLLPCEHKLSSLQTTPSVRNEIFVLAKLLNASLRSENETVLVGEHGNQSTHVSGGFAPHCVSHAHLHLLPLPLKFVSILKAYTEVLGDKYVVLSDDEMLKADINSEYHMISDCSGSWFLWTDFVATESQFIRRVAANCLGVANEFNWREHPQFEKIDQTKALLKPILGNIHRNEVRNWEPNQADFNLSD